MGEARGELELVRFRGFEWRGLSTPPLPLASSPPQQRDSWARRSGAREHLSQHGMDGKVEVNRPLNSGSGGTSSASSRWLQQLQYPGRGTQQSVVWEAL